MHCSIDNDRGRWSAQIIYLWLGWFCFGSSFAVADESQSSRGLTDTTATAHVQLHSVGLAETKWTHGLWADRFETCRKNSLPTLATIMLGEHASQTPSQYLGNFNVAAGKVQGKHRGASFNDGDFYKWLEAVAAVFAATKDPTLDRMMDECIESIAAAQRPDGYLQTSIILRQCAGDAAAKPFTDPLQFEAYNLGHLLTAACIHYRATGKTSLLDVARKAADYFNALLAQPTPQLARCAICPSHYMGTIELYRTTGEAKYLEMAKRLIELRDLVRDGTDDNQDRIPFRRQREAVGHAVRANYLYAGAADVYAETGDESLLVPLKAIWDNMVHEKMYVTGACGALFDGASPDGSKDQSQSAASIRLTAATISCPTARPTTKPAPPSAMCCGTGGCCKLPAKPNMPTSWNWPSTTPCWPAKAWMANRSSTTNTLRQLDTMPADLRWSAHPPTVLQQLLLSAEPGDARLPRSLTMPMAKPTTACGSTCTGGNVLDTTVGGETLKLTQETDYPWDGQHQNHGECGANEGLLDRAAHTGMVEGCGARRRGHATQRAVVAGNVFQTESAVEARRRFGIAASHASAMLQAHPLVEEGRNQVAVQRGPLVYCLESPDLPAG